MLKTGMSIRDLCYELYKIDWLRRISPERQMDSIKNYYEDQKMDDVETTYEEVLDEFGFGGEFYACFSEFLLAESRDTEYMEKLLGNEMLFNEYVADLNKLLEEAA